MKLFFLIFFFTISLTAFSISHAADDPFSRSFTADQGDIEEEINSQDSKDNETIESEVNEKVHPLIRFNINKYFIKGIILSEIGSLVITSYPGGLDYVQFKGDPIGNQMHVIKEIKLDYVLVSSSDGEEIKISVMNESIKIEKEQEG
tara:strand:- start:152 stop:592 length:441 start_codon:yes stop_codon:yes gene_type:complete